MKTLNTIQKLSKIGQIFSKIIFIFCIIGFCGCIVGILSMAIGAPTLKIGGVTLESILSIEAGVTTGTPFDFGGAKEFVYCDVSGVPLWSRIAQRKGVTE